MRRKFERIFPAPCPPALWVPKKWAREVNIPVEDIHHTGKYVSGKYTPFKEIHQCVHQPRKYNSEGYTVHHLGKYVSGRYIPAQEIHQWKIYAI